MFGCGNYGNAILCQCLGVVTMHYFILLSLTMSFSSSSLLYNTSLPNVASPLVTLFHPAQSYPVFYLLSLQFSPVSNVASPSLLLSLTPSFWFWSNLCHHANQAVFSFGDFKVYFFLLRIHNVHLGFNFKVQECVGMSGILSYTAGLLLMKN